MFINERRAQTLMDQAGVDGLVGTRLENVFYLTGIWNLSQVLFPYDQQCYAVVTPDHFDKPVVVISVGDWDQSLTLYPASQTTLQYGTFYRELTEGRALDECENFLKAETIDRVPHKNALDALVAALEDKGLADKRIALDEKAFNPALRPELESRLPKLKIQPAANLLRQIRMVKTEPEILRLRKAAMVTEQAIRAATAVARPGVTEREMAHEFQRSIISQGGEPLFTMVHFGRHAALGQVPPDDTRLERGDGIWFDVGCRVGGYTSDLARIFVLGEPSDKLRRYYQAVLAGENYQIESTRPGATAGEIYDNTLRVVRDGGIPHYRRTHVGHGIGVEVYDIPLLAPGQTDRIEAGTVLNFETPYYELGWGAAHIEDPVVIREGGNQVLTTLSRELGIIE